MRKRTDQTRDAATDNRSRFGLDDDNALADQNFITSLRSMKAPFLLVSLFIILSPGLHAAPPEKDPIDIAMDKAMEKDPSTAGMVQAASQADKKWQKETERALATLKKEMTAEQRKALQASQQAWKNYRDKEVATQSALYGALEGSMWIPVAASKEMDLDRARALLLRDYLEALSEQ